MKMPVTRLWDSEVIFIYSLFGGLIDADNSTVHLMLNSLINNKDCRPIALDTLINLENKGKITVKKRLYAGKTFRAILSQDNIFELKLFAEGSPLMPTRRFEQIELEIDVPDKEWFRNMVNAYLGVFRSDMIFAPFGKSELTFVQHRENILNQLPFPLNVERLYGELRRNSDCFIETLLSLALDEQIVIKYIDVGRKPKLNGHNEIHFTATVVRTHKLVHDGPDNHPDQLSQIAEVRIDGRQILIGLKGEELVPLGGRMRFEGPFYNFIHYVHLHPNQPISKLDIHNLPECQKYEDMTELVRQCRFNKQLKDIFFVGTDRTTVRFTPVKQLSGKQLEQYKNVLTELREKNEKNRS